MGRENFGRLNNLIATADLRHRTWCCLGGTYRKGQTLKTRKDRVRYLAIRQCQRIAGDSQTVYAPTLAGQEHPAYPTLHRSIARKPSDSVETCGKRDNALDRDRAVSRAHSENPAKSSGHTHRPPGVCAEREVDEPRGDRPRPSRSKSRLATDPGSVG
jgi:hypothetical protein